MEDPNGSSGEAFDRLVGGRRVVNPGSVGMGYGHRGAAWALLGPTVELRRTHYDAAEAAARLAKSRWDGAAQWAEEYVLHPAGDLEALEVFTRLARHRSA